MRTAKLPPSTTRSLTKHAPPDAGNHGGAAQIASASEMCAAAPPPFSAILLGSPGETLDGLQVSAKTSKDGTRAGLQGVLRDLMLARAFLVHNSYGIFECMHGMRLFKCEVLGALKLFFSQQHQPRHFVIYFSGHGNQQTGNWVFTDGQVSLYELFDLFTRYAPSFSSLSLVADCCHSGAWVEQMLACPHDFDPQRFAVQAACLKDEVCWDTKVGGMFTKSWVSGAYYRLAKQQAWEHRGEQRLVELQSSFKSSLSSWVPWNRFLSNNPGVLACGFLAASSFLACSKECASALGDSDLVNSQHPIATHPFAFNLAFYDARFAEMPPAERFPPPSVLSTFIDLKDFWLGKS